MNYPPEQQLYDDPFSPFGNTQVNLYCKWIYNLPQSKVENISRNIDGEGGLNDEKYHKL